MAKAFLSHSSKQKQSYVEIVARRLGPANCVYDRFTFEEGMGNLEEIQRGMNSSDIFVLFISDDALNSEWVKKEILDSYELISEGVLKRIFPIIIDRGITYEDSRIPEWMRNGYNLQYVSRPVIAARRIKQRLIELSWDYHPLLKEKQNLFVGRNAYMGQFEERIDSFEYSYPVAFFACGLNHIGRKSLISYALKKANIVKQSYLFPKITLNSDESVEDFINKVYDMGFSETRDFSNMLSMSISDKIKIAVDLLNDMDKAREILMIIDDGCIVSPGGELAQWFDSIIRNFESDNKVRCAIASRFRLHMRGLSRVSYIYSINVAELDIKERVGLLKRYAALQQVDIDQEAIDIIVGNLQGFPEQVFFTIDTVKESGLNYIKTNPHVIIEYNAEKVSRVINKYQDDESAFDFLNLLCQFDFISYNYIFDIVGSEVLYKDLLREFEISSIVEHIGPAKEYFRVNDVIRDYINRIRKKLSQKFEDNIQAHTADFLKNHNDQDDVSEYIYSIKRVLTSGGQVPGDLLIPSHFLKSMKEVYDRGNNYSLVVELADRALFNSQYMDKNIKKLIRYYLCLALIRQSDSRFMVEVQKVSGPDHDYLFGFYYRLSGRSGKAIDSLNKFLAVRLSSLKGKRELVQVLIDIEEYERALHIAKENYEIERLNPFVIQAYIKCLLKVKPSDYRAIVENLIEDLGSLKGEASREMFLNSQAYFSAVFEMDEQKSLKLINQAIEEFPDNPYPVLTKLEICEKFKNVEELDRALRLFKQKNRAANTHRNTAIAFEAKLKGLRGDKISAISLVDSRLVGLLPESAIVKLKQKIHAY